MSARQDGYAPISSYGALGDGRTVALVAADGQVDWWPMPRLDSPPICAAILDPERGGYFSLRPVPRAPGGAASQEQPCPPPSCQRRYVPGTNVLETVYSTPTGKLRVTDSLNTGQAGRLPWNELARRVEVLEGQVDVEWSIVPGARLGGAKCHVEMRGGVPLVTLEDQLLAVVSKGSRLTEVGPRRVAGRIEGLGRSAALLGVVATDREPLFIPQADDIDARIDRTVKRWRDWSDQVPPEGPWSAAVQRSALALKVLFHEPDGAIAAAATTSLPERIGGSKNYDYRFAWVRDTSFTVGAFINVGLDEEVQAATSWIFSALSRSAPKLHVFYTLQGGRPGREIDLDAPGYRGSRPVRSGNSASNQLQLGVYGDLFDMVGRYVAGGHVLDGSTARVLSQLADQCCRDWRRKDSGIWELKERQHYTISKIGCWVALDRACQLAKAGQLPRENAARWAGEAHAIKEWVNQECWSEDQRSYTFYAGTEKLDAAVLLAGRTGFERGPRLTRTIEAVVGQLGRGPMLHRYSGMEEEEGAFIACSFWLVSALAHNGQVEKARELMGEAVELSNDVGLLSEQIDPATGEFLGNIPQGLSHLALINAAHALNEAPQRGADGGAAPGAGH